MGAIMINNLIGAMGDHCPASSATLISCVWDFEESAATLKKKRTLNYALGGEFNKILKKNKVCFTDKSYAPLSTDIEPTERLQEYPPRRYHCAPRRTLPVVFGELNPQFHPRLVHSLDVWILDAQYLAAILPDVLPGLDLLPASFAPKI